MIIDYLSTLYLDSDLLSIADLRREAEVREPVGSRCLKFD